MVNQESEFRVKVAVRVRPFLPKEKNHEQKSCVAIHPQTNQIVLGDRRTFKYDFVFGPKVQQEELYQTCVEPLLGNVFDGYNVTVLAYGQTGSGKTFTMTGGNILSIGESEYGIVPRAVRTIFETLQSRPDIRTHISASYLEIYKDDIIDLLDSTDKTLDIREDASGNTVVIGASEHLCHSINDVVCLLKKGSSVRHTGATQMNDESSRSHAIFTLHIEQHQNAENVNGNLVQASFDGIFRPVQSHFDENYLSAKLHFVDLAGSERVARTQNTGERFQESIRINSGLLALSNVVSALSDPKKRPGGHIPYRASKLTRLLKDSLGGNAKTLMITCVSPCIADLDESLNALRYAHRASQIRNKPIKNVDPNAQRFIEMQSEITHLREELERQRTLFSREGASVNTRRSNTSPRHEHLRRLIQTAFVYFQQLNRSHELTEEQKQWIQTWMEAVSHDHSEEIHNDLLTGQMTHLEQALQTAQNELRCESQLRVQRDLIVQQLQDELQAKENELNRMRLALEQRSTIESGKDSHPIDQLPMKKSVANRAKSAPYRESLLSKDVSIPPRNIHSSPAVFNMDYVVERFHDRSLALAQSREEIEELDLPSNDDAFPDDHKIVRQGTYRVRKRRAIPSVLDANGTLQSLTQSTMTKQKLIDEAKRKVEQAESQAQDLSKNIQMKEQLIKSVLTSKSDVTHTNDEYEQQIKLLEKETEKAKHEYQDLQKAMQQLTSRNTQEKSKLENEYRKKCETVKSRLDALQRKQKQYRELMTQLTGNSEKRIVDLQSQLFRMKQHYENALKRIREETELKNKFEQDLLREQQRMQELKIQNEQQQKVLKLKTEGLAAVQRKLRHVTHGNPSDAMITWEMEMEKLIAERQELETLRNDIEKREELMKKREMLLHERSELETKKVRLSEQGTSGNPTPSNHQILREELLRQKHQYTERQSNQTLTGAEERRLIEIDEAIEAVDLAIDFQNNIIHKRERNVQQSIRASQGPDSALFKINQLNAEECKQLCRKLFEKVVDLKDEDHRNQRAFEELKSQLNEQNEIIAELQSRLQSLTIDHDRHITSTQQNHEEEKQLLLQQLQDLTKQVKELEKDLFFYKHKNRELRKSIAAATGSLLNNESTEVQAGHQSSRSSFHLHSGKRSTSVHQQS